MEISGNTILITGGATGIGFEIARLFVEAGNEVIVCSRTQANLDEAKAKLPGVHTGTCDLADKAQREVFVRWIQTSFPKLNVLINNAGIQRMIDLKRSSGQASEEIAINFAAPVELSALLIPHLAKHENAAIVNVSSGLGFVPLAVVPVYSATKAAIHSFTVSLRRQLRDTNIKVFELIPPTTDTNLDKGSREERGMTNRGIPPSEVATAFMAGWQEDRYEIVVGEASRLVNGAKQNFDQVFSGMNR